MNDLENQPANQFELTPSQADFDALKQLVNTILILVVIMSGALTVFLYRQYTLIHEQTEGFRRQFNETEAQYQQVKPRMDDFARRISEFARTHPDFAAMVAKYGVTTAKAPSAPGPAPAPAKK